MSENHHVRNPTKKPKKYKGLMKLLDIDHIGYISCGKTEVFVTPFSLTSDTIKQGDMVRFSVKTRVLNSGFEAIDVERYGVECHRCLRTGHKAYDCPDNMKYYWINCYKCGFVGHYADNCDQKFHGWFDDEIRNKRRFIKRSCDCDYGCWLSLFGGNCRKVGVKDYKNVGFGYNLVLSSFHLYWPHLIESRFCTTNKSISYYDDYDDDSEENEDEEELRCIVCVKKGEDVRKVEEVEDCFILEFDPSELLNLGKLSLNDNSKVVVDDEDDLCILGEKGKVACRDYPHSRHLCANNPFQTTPHESHCKMCYCYVCDIPAPCTKWTNMGKDHCFDHCNASEDSDCWRNERASEKKRMELSLRSTPIVG